jgi:TetR/AcrR family transcriptional repressor of nem operon
MHVFWKNGYEATSVRLLEKEMGINQFSIYASFKNKEGVFLESMKYYNKKLNDEILNDLENSEGGIKNIKTYFYDFLSFSEDEGKSKGCLLTNTVSELDQDKNKVIFNKINDFVNHIMQVFKNALHKTKKYNTDKIEEITNHLIVSLQGLSVASKSLKPKQLNDFIELTFSIY